MLFLCVLNLKFFSHKFTKNTQVAKYSLFAILLLLMSSFHKSKHPFYVSVVELNYKQKEQTLQVSVKLFSNDLEDALQRTSKKNIDLLHPKHQTENDSVLLHYISKRLAIQVNSKTQVLNFIGYEKEEEAIWTYLEIKNCAVPKNIRVDTHLLYDYLPQQINIVHADINGTKKSSKVTNPEYHIEFIF
jgi:hypothetical protein